MVGNLFFKVFFCEYCICTGIFIIWPFDSTSIFSIFNLMSTQCAHNSIASFMTSVVPDQLASDEAS